MVTAKCFKRCNFMTLAAPGLARMFACLFVCVCVCVGGGVPLFVCLCMCVCILCLNLFLCICVVGALLR